MSSSVSYQKTFPKYPRVNISLSSLSQNNNTKTANLTLPTFQGNMERIFHLRTVLKVLYKINLQLTTLAENRIQTTEEELFKKMFKDAVAGVDTIFQYQQILKLQNISVLVLVETIKKFGHHTIKYNDYENGIEASKDTIRKFDAFRTYNYSASAGTTLYGIVNFKGKNRVN